MLVTLVAFLLIPAGISIAAWMAYLGLVRAELQFSKNVTLYDTPARIAGAFCLGVVLSAIIATAWVVVRTSRDRSELSRDGRSAIAIKAERKGESVPAIGASGAKPEDLDWLFNDPAGGDPYVAFVDHKVGVSFPRTLASLEFVGRDVYEEPGAGYSLRYAHDLLKVDIYVYDKNLLEIPNGCVGEPIDAELRSIESSIRHYERLGAYRDVEQLDAGEYLVEESELAFQWLRLRYRQQPGPGVAYAGLRFSEAFVRGFRDHFVKVRVTYPAESTTTIRTNVMRELAELLIDRS